MANQPGYLLSEATVRKLAADHQRLQHEVYAIKQQLAATQQAPDWGRELYWGKTTKRSGSYPTSGNTFDVLLASRTFTNTSTGTKAITNGDSTGPVQYVTARTTDGSYVAENTYVVVERQWAVDGMRHWIRPGPPGGVFTATGETSGAYALRDGDSATSSFPIIGWGVSAANYKQVKAYPSLRGQGSNVAFTVFANSAGDVFYVNDAPTAFTDNWVTVKQNGKYRIMATGTYKLASVTSGDADTYLRAAQHRHGYGAGLYTNYETPQALSLETFYHEMSLSVSISGPAVYSCTNSLQYYYSAHTVYANVTVIAYFERSGSDKTVDLLWASLGPGTGAALAESKHCKTQATIERTGDL
jgi:hypothetical protein